MFDTYSIMSYGMYVHLSRNVVLFTMILFVKRQGCAVTYNYLQCWLLKTRYNTCRPLILFTLLEVITSNTRDSVLSGYPNTMKRVENLKCSRIFLMKFDGQSEIWMANEPLSWVFDNLLSRNVIKRAAEKTKSSKSMLIKTGYPNLPRGCNFLCFNLMNY